MIEVLPPSIEPACHELNGSQNKALAEIVFPVIQGLQWNQPLNGLETHFFSQDLRDQTPLPLKHKPNDTPNKEGQTASKSTVASSTSRVQQGPILSPLDCFTQRAQSVSRPLLKESSYSKPSPPPARPVVSSVINPSNHSANPIPKEITDVKAQMPSPSHTAKQLSSCKKEKDSHPKSSEDKGLLLMSKSEPQAVVPHPTHFQSDQRAKDSDHSDTSLSWDEEDSPSSTEVTSIKVGRVAHVHFQSFSHANSSPVLTPDTSLILELLQQDAELVSEMLNKRASHFDVLLIFMALMKLEIESQEEEKLARRAERITQLQYLEKEVANLRSQSKSLLFAHIGAGLFGVISGLSPIIGHMKGGGILAGLSSVFSSLNGIKKKDFFESISKITMSISETQKASGQIYGTFAEGDRTRYSRYGELHGRDQEERTRCIEQLQERCRQMERFLSELLQMRHDVTSQLYR